MRSRMPHLRKSWVVESWVAVGCMGLALSCGANSSGPGDTASTSQEDTAQQQNAARQGASQQTAGTAAGAGSPSVTAQGALFGAPEPVLAGGVCTGTLAQQTFAKALCSCEDTNVAGYLKTRFLSAGDITAAGTATTDNADDDDADDDPSLLGGSVGVNRNYATGGYADVGGSFTVTGDRDVQFAGLLKAGQDLELQPAADVAGVVRVGGDARLGAPLQALGRVAVAGNVYSEQSSAFRGIAVVSVGGSTVTQPVEIAPPCPCGAGEQIDVAGLIADAASNNDNASIGLNPNAVDLAIGIGKALELPSGRFYLERVGTLGGISLNINGKTALFVADDLLATGAFRTELAPGAELDLFIQGDLGITGTAQFGDRTRPAATRVYVAGDGDIAVAGYGAFAGNLYAPAADIRIGGYGQIYGSLFGKNITAAGFLSVGYDTAFTTPGAECPPPASDVPRIQ
jgi:hypothetical protein